MGYILGVATLLGGIAAIVFFWDKHKQCNKWQEKEKLVDNNWLEMSHLKDSYRGGSRWSNADKVEERKLKGYEIVFEEDKTNKVRYRLVNNSGQILIGKKVV